ncbi:hypothetical protein MRS44_001879 [Fusarium solani]|uniref:Uncharacterized protein n=1 Tax=Fusarium solani TaxID=169388 RepID=A0A9P9JRA4_FUSSL|nr:uncharacterized protein B0J15DRAFT_155208 [Fusarium solani]KAH7234073.1 hypothetical protein B0J15DRAFT_155208 [Fusarium solani]KAJ3471780.1 hypothetical protein MRS44_001879 [Fusarium solani]
MASLTSGDLSGPCTLASTPETNPSTVAPDDPAITIQFTSIPKLFKEIDAATGDILVVQNISQQDYNDIMHERDRRRRKFRLKRYYSESQMLIVTIPTMAHEILHAPLFGYIQAAVIQMGLDDVWYPMATTTYRTQGHPNRDGGEGDSSGGPIERQGPLWPTLVIEAGYSQTLVGLRRDMRWWFSASNHQVKIVLLAKLDSNHGQIIIEKWQEGPSGPRQGATTTRAAARLEPRRSQLITISRGSNTAHRVSRGPLRLEFALLFLRAPGQGEGDIVVSDTQLQRVASGVWRIR